MEKAEVADKKRQETEAQKHKELLELSQARATSAQKELDELKAKAGNWMSELNKINSEMASKYSYSFYFGQHNLHADMKLISALLPLFPEHFPHSQATAENVTRKARLKRAESCPISEAWDINDHLTALNARLSPLKAIGVDLLDAAIRVYKSLWPGSEAPASISELTNCLKACEERLSEWRALAARVGADEALTFILSWYEGINLDVLQTLRSGSKWTTDPELIQRRQERAYSFIRYAQIHNFIEGPEDSDDDEEDDEEVDEEVQNDTAPSIAADIAATMAASTSTGKTTDTAA